jgi:sugar phosphate isomerase/epimerase
MQQQPALSTMWSQLRYEKLTDFISAARLMGFKEVELSHIVTPEMMRALPASFFEAVRVLHHPCPNPGGVPELSAQDEKRRRAALDAAKQTIEWAVRVEAKVIVMHLGLVSVDRRWENAIRARWLQGELQAPAFNRLAAQIQALRAAKAEAHLDAARRSLAELVPIAAQHEIKLALENGEWCFSIPTLEEARRLLSEFDSPALGIWLDSGHATIQERLGFDSLLAWLKLAPKRLLGFHYHDVNGLRDHLIPGNGTIDWQSVASHVPPHALPSCEFDWYYTSEEIVAGVEHLKTLGVL